VTGVARYLVGNCDEVVREMEQLPKHRDRLLWVAAESRSPSRSAYGGALISSTAVSFRFALGLVRRVPCLRHAISAVVRGYLGSRNGRPAGGTRTAVAVDQALRYLSRSSSPTVE
jgi:hypothetical protein